jgi:uncharacterized protein (TIGR02453 family)
MAGFKGFPEDCIGYLQQLKINNNRGWFQEHSGEYEAFVREPALGFIEAMSDELSGISPRFRAVPKKVGGSLMRVHRDTRFSKDKTPYKTNIGIQFRHEMGKDVHAPGFYVHIEPEYCFLGVGIWHPDSTSLSSIRDFISDNPHAWRSVLNDAPFRKHFQLEGESLKKAPRGYPTDHELIDDLKRKDFIACRNFNCEKITKPGFVCFVQTSFAMADSFMRYLCMAVSVPYD